MREDFNCTFIFLLFGSSSEEVDVEEFDEVEEEEGEEGEEGLRALSSTKSHKLTSFLTCIIKLSSS